MAESLRDSTLFAAKTNPFIILNPGAKAAWLLNDPLLSSIVGVFTNNSRVHKLINSRNLGVFTNNSRILIYHPIITITSQKKTVKHLKQLVLFLAFFIFFPDFVQSQSLPANFPVIEESIRRKQLLDKEQPGPSLLLRPLQLVSLHPFLDSMGSFSLTDKVEMRFLPLLSTTRQSTSRPYGWGDYSMIPSVGMQQFISTGVYAKYKFIHFQFQPELVLAQNSRYQGYSDEFGGGVNNRRFTYWNQGDFPERFGDGTYARISLGQSRLTAHFGAFEAGFSTQNLWWGPGQFNALIFSNNAQGFPHFSINTHKPAKTFLGNFEGQMLIGRLENSDLAPTQNTELNERYFVPYTGGWRYLNAIMLSYQNKWLPGLSLGFTRTFQQTNRTRGSRFSDYLPVFTGLLKENFIQDGGFAEFDEDGRDQQLSVFFRWVIPSLKGEFYAEYGKRDHNVNIREALINPEHARAYILGFKKLLEIGAEGEFIQIRGEVTQQQESINRLVRYGPRGGSAWHNHSVARGFAHNGQPLGVGIGVGSNVKTIEIAYVKELNKYGILFERLENHQDFYVKAFGQQEIRQPWVDLSLGFLLDYEFDRLLISSKVQFINALNYQWQLHPDSTPDFPVGRDLFSVFAQAHLIYKLAK